MKIKSSLLLILFNSCIYSTNNPDGNNAQNNYPQYGNNTLQGMNNYIRLSDLFTLHQPGPIALSMLPLNKPYDQLTTEQKKELHNIYSTYKAFSLKRSLLFLFVRTCIVLLGVDVMSFGYYQYCQMMLNLSDLQYLGEPYSNIIKLNILYCVGMSLIFAIISFIIGLFVFNYYAYFDASNMFQRSLRYVIWCVILSLIECYYTTKVFDATIHTKYTKLQEDKVFSFFGSRCEPVDLNKVILYMCLGVFTQNIGHCLVWWVTSKTITVPQYKKLYFICRHLEHIPGKGLVMPLPQSNDQHNAYFYSNNTNTVVELTKTFN